MDDDVVEALASGEPDPRIAECERRARSDAAMRERYRIEMTQFIAGDCPSCMRTPTEIWCQSGSGCVRIKLQAEK